MDIENLAEWNPWWITGTVPESLLGRPRQKYATLMNSINIKEITILTGVRRAGKSTLMYQMVDGLLKNGVPSNHILFVNLEDFKLINDSLDDIYNGYRRNVNPDQMAYIFFDEIQRKGNWELWIKRQFDLGARCKFVISGSCSYLLKREYATLLTGRNLTFDVFPLDFAEFLMFKNINIDMDGLRKGLFLDEQRNVIINALGEFIKDGGFPAVFLTSREFKKPLLAQYFNDILYKDIIGRHDLDSHKIQDLALFLATNTTSLVSLRTVRNALGLSYDTIKDYLSFFRDAFLFFTIDYFSYSVKEQEIKPSKIYFIDNGLRNAIAFKFSKDEGKLVENLVFLDLKSRGKEVYYWKGKGEVDFIIKESDGLVTAINVSFGDDIPAREVASIMEFKSHVKNVKASCVITKEKEGNESGINFIPLWKWLLRLPEPA
nr:ATP-binding protein [Candidatus Sigynarchaeota archaeon]